MPRICLLILLLCSTVAPAADVALLDVVASPANRQPLAWRCGPEQLKMDLTEQFSALDTRQWQRARRLEATVSLDGLATKAPLRLQLRINGERWFHFTAGATVRPGQPQALSFDLSTLPTRVGPGAVREVLLEWVDAPAGECTLRVDKLRLTAAREDDPSVALVDRYGQYVRGDWPEKVATDADLKRQDDRERQWLATHPRPAGRDRFGGDTTAAKFRASGYFRLDRDAAGTHWLVTPEGHRFFSYGIDAASVWKFTDVSQRRALFQWLPEGEFADALEGTHLRSHVANLRRKYGTGWREAWVQRSNQRLWAWGMNTWGAWADDVITRTQQAPWTLCLQLQWQKEWTALPRVTELIPDPFDPAFERHLNDVLPAHLTPVREDRWLIGIYLANELKWYQLDERQILSLPPTSAAKLALKAMLQKKYPTPQAWAAAWQIQAADWAALDRLTLATDAAPSAAMAVDLRQFRGELADRFFATFASAVRKLAPNHLILGTRFLHFPASQQAPDEVYAACGRHCDAVSENAYTLRPDPAYFARRSAMAGKPVLITEFHFGVQNDPRQLGWGVRWVPTRQDRAAALAAYVEAVAKMPAVVGCHWFEYSDQPLLGRQDGENYQIGFVDVADTPYDELIAASRRAGEHIYEWRSGGRRK